MNDNKKKFKIKAGDRDRNLTIPSRNSMEIIDLIRRSTDFTFSTTLQQRPRDIGTIISFKNGENDK